MWKVEPTGFIYEMAQKRVQPEKRYFPGIRNQEFVLKFQ